LINIVKVSTFLHIEGLNSQIKKKNTHTQRTLTTTKVQKLNTKIKSTFCLDKIYI